MYDLPMATTAQSPAGDCAGEKATHKIMEDWRLLKEVEPMTPEIQAEVNSLLQRIQTLNNRAWSEF
jgi:hypothetical protein